MNKRITELELNINTININKVEKATQGDTNTHFLHLVFMNEIDLEGYKLQITYQPPYPETIPYVDTYTNLKQELDILIPNVILRRSGKVTVDFSLIKDEETLTINKNFTFEIIKTINGSNITAFPEGNLKLTLTQQITKITELLEKTEEKITEYNSNAIKKTEIFDENATSKTTTFNNNVQAKTTEFDRHSSEIVNQAYQAMEQQAGISASSAATKANELVVVQQNKSIKEVQTATTESKNNAISEIERKTLEQVEVVKTQGTTSKGEVEQAGTTAIDNINTAKNQVINSIDTSKNSAIQALNDEKVKQNQAITDQGDLTKQGVVEEGNKVVRANKTELDTYVNATSKPHIDNYVTQKEGEIKGATFTPTVDEEGNISWVNDKNLENPITKNLKGPKGDPGNFVFKVENGHLILYTVDNGKAPIFKLENGHLIMEIV